MRSRAIRGVIRWVLLVFALLLFIVGFIAWSYGSIAGGSEELVQFAATVMPASLVAGASIFAVQTWADTRAGALDEKSREAIENLAHASMRVVGGTIDLRGSELPMRAGIATWGSAELLSKLAERTKLIDSIASQVDAEINRVRREAGDPNALLNLHVGERMSHVALVTAEMLVAARKDLGLPKSNAKQIYESIWGTVEKLDYDGAVLSQQRGVYGDIQVEIGRRS